MQTLSCLNKTDNWEGQMMSYRVCTRSLLGPTGELIPNKKFIYYCYENIFEN